MTGSVTFNRRSILALLATLPATPALARLGWADDLAVFDDVVRAVGGVAYLPEPLLDGCRLHFAKTFGEEAIYALADLARNRRSLSEMERLETSRVGDRLEWIATFLYTGETAEGITYYPWALGWHALSFATAPGQCGGPFGHWVGPQL